MRIRVALLTIVALVAGFFFAGSAFAIAPANDAFAAGTPTATGVFTGNNTSATGESGEPDHAGASLGSGCTNATTPTSGCETSIWFTWTPAATGSYTIDTCNSGFDTTLGVYTGTTVNALSTLASNNDLPVVPGGGCAGGPAVSKVTLDAASGTAYHVAVAGAQAATGSVGGTIQLCGSTDLTKGTTSCAPSATTNAGSTPLPSGTGETLNATVNPNGFQTSYHFEYGTTTSYGTSSPLPEASAGTGFADVAESRAVTGLTPATTYHYRIVATNQNGTSKGADKTFTTAFPPTVTTTAATNVSGTTATFNGTVNPNSQPTTYSFEYGTTQNGPYPNQAPMPAASAGSGNTVANESQNVTGLTTGTTYYYRIVATNPVGTSTGNEISFTTLGPTATTEPATAVTNTTATLNGLVNPNTQSTTYHFDWGTTTSYGFKAPIPDATLAQTDTTNHAVSANITKLTPGTTYHYRLEATNASGTSDGADMTFVAFTGGISPTIVGHLADVNGDGVVNSSDDAHAFFGDASIIDGHLDCDTWNAQGQPVNAGTAGNGQIDGSDDCTLLAYDGSPSGQTIQVTDGAFQLPDGPMPTVYPDPATPTDGTVSGADFAWQVIGGRVDANGNNTIDDDDCSIGLVGSSNVLSAGTSQTNSCGFAYTGTQPSSINGLVDVDNDLTITSSDSCANGCFFGHDVSNGFVQAETAPVATTTAATNVRDTTAQLNATINPRSQATTFHFDYGTDSTFTSKTSTTESTTPLTGSTTQNVSTNLSSLAPATTYYFRVVATNASGTTTDSQNPPLSFTTLAAPTVTTGNASNVADTTATLNGTVNPNGDDTAYHFVYGTDPSLQTGTTRVPANSANDPDAGSGTTAVSEHTDLTGLTRHTTYYFEIVANNSVGTSTGTINSFTTLAAAPTVTTGNASNVAATTATLNGTVNPNGDDTHYHFVYGTDPTLQAGTTRAPASSANDPDAGSGTSSVAANVDITGLTAGTTYYFEIVANNSIGTTTDSINSFTTLAAPTVTTGNATAITGTTATLNGTVNPNGDDAHYHFVYGTDPALSTGTTRAPASSANDPDAGSGSTAVNASVDITGLTAGTTYYFEIVAGNSVGTSTGAIHSFATLPTPTTTTGNASNVTGKTATLNGSVNPNGNVTTYHFEYGTTTGYGTSTADASAGSGSSAVNESANIIGLTQGTIYHFRIVATSSAGTTHGNDMTFSACGNCKDFNNDGHTDVLYWNKSTGETSVWFLGGTNGIVQQGAQTAITPATNYPSNTWVPVATADFDRDGKTDILYWNKGNGHLTVWLMNGTTETGPVNVTPSTTFPSTTWIPQAVGDFDGDGHQDILYWNKGNGKTTVWFMGGTNGASEIGHSNVAPGSAGYPSTSWVPESTSDFNQDGKTDIFYWNRSNGHTSVWLMNGITKTASSNVLPDSAGFPNTSWIPVGSADYNLDTHPDVFYWNSNTAVTTVWFMGGTNGTAKQSSHNLTGTSGFPTTSFVPIT